MTITGLLDPRAVRTGLAAGSKKRLFQQIAGVAHMVYGLDEAATMAALQEREALGPTGVGRGVALPHARVSGLSHMAGCFVRLDQPLAFGAPDRQPVDLAFALFAPAASGVGHLKALACVSRLMRERALCAKLRANDDPAVLHALLTEPSTAVAA